LLVTANLQRQTDGLSVAENRDGVRKAGVPGTHARRAASGLGAPLSAGEARGAVRPAKALHPDFTVSRFRAGAGADNPRYLPHASVYARAA
jgi:hypothetical protein